MSKFNIDKCPFCGCAELAKGYQAGHGAVLAGNTIFSSSNIIHIICTNCGSIVHSYVQKPEKFKRKIRNRY